ncbi:MAG: hypothetical protein ACYC5G_01190 [Candidatus Doudnabacteria bacterium]
MSYETTQAISLGNQITDFLSSAMIDNYASGNRETAEKQSWDCCLVRSLVKSLEFYNLNGADTEFTADQIADVIAKINEYESSLLLDIQDFAVQVGSEVYALGSGSYVIVNGSSVIQPTPHVYSFTVATNNQTIFVLPFNVSSVDTDSLYLTLNSASNPIFGVDYTIVGTQMTWTGEYPLSAGWEFELKYYI